MSDPREPELIRLVSGNVWLMLVLRRARRLHLDGRRLPDWRVFSGAVYQTVWNHSTRREPDYGLKDYDLAYFDPDLGWEAEDLWIKAASREMGPRLAPLVELRNQARVHLWFEERFGEPYPPLTCTDEALERFVAPAFAVGVRFEDDGRITVAAPFGLEDLFNMVLRPNPLRPLARGWARAVESVRARWPEVTVIEP